MVCKSLILVLPVCKSLILVLPHKNTEHGTVRVRFLHSFLHILCFDICIDWQEKTNDKTQVSASFLGVQNQKKQKKQKQKKNIKKNKQKKNKKQQENQENKTRKPRRPTGPECLWHRVVVFFLGFLVFCFLFVLDLVTFDLLEVLLALSQIFPTIWRS